MKEKIKENKIIVLIVVLILIGLGIGGLILQRQHQKAANFCKEKCVFGVKKPQSLEEIMSSRPAEIQNIWGYYPNRFDISPERSFPYLDQCIDYCLLQVKINL